MSDFALALAALRADLPPIRKRTKGQHGNYANYHDIKKLVDPVLAKHGFLWETRPTLIPYPDGWRFVLSYQLTHLETGQARGGDFPLQEMDPQRQGSQISYAKRYALCAVLDLAPEGEDDDGMAASKPERTRTRTTGPDHERLRDGTVEPTPDDRPAERGPTTADPWQDQPPGQLAQPPRKASKGQHGYIAQMFRDRGITDDDVRHGMLSQMLGREIGSQGELTMRDANVVIRQLQGGNGE